MKFFRFLLDISWKHIVIATVAGLVSGTGNALLISLINYSVNKTSVSNALYYFIGLAVFVLATSTISQFVLIYLSQNAIFQLRLKLSKNILSSPLQHLEKLGDNRLLATLTEDVRVLSHAVAAIPNLCIDVATVIGCLAYLAWLSGIIFALSIFSTSLAIWIVQTRLGKARVLFSAAREEEDNLLKHFQSIIMGIKELKLHQSRKNDFWQTFLFGSATQLRQKNTKAMQSFAISNGVGQLSQFISLGFIIFVLPLLLHIPQHLLSTYVLTSTFIALPMQNLLNRIPDFMKGNIALHKIERMKFSLVNHAEIESVEAETFEVRHLTLKQVSYSYYSDAPHPEGMLQDRPEFPDRPEFLEKGKHPQNHPKHPPHQDRPEFLEKGKHPQNHPNHPKFGESLPLPPQRGEILHFVQDDSPNHPPHPPHPHNRFHPPMEEKEFLLGPINLSFQPGEITYIVGGNGSGKSTLGKLITGLYTPESGAIYLNGVMVTAQNLEWYRQHFSAIFSDFYLFDRCLGFKYDSLDQDVEKYLKQLQLNHKVKVKNGVLSTTRLSQGQRKRLALLTAYLEDRPIYLFDEWASDQEPLFRDVFYNEILFKLKERGKIVIVITHDDRYFHLADNLIKLDYGKVHYNSNPLAQKAS